MLFTLLAGISVYFIYHLNQFNKVIRSIILRDTLVIDYSTKLSDALFSEFRNDRKFIILKDEELFENSIKAAHEFNETLHNVITRTTAVEIKELFTAIDVEHQKFTQLVQSEKELLRSTEPYSKESFAEEKNRIADSIIEQLNIIRLASENKVLGKIVALNERGGKAKNVSLIISIIALTTGLTVAFLITRSIKKPLDVMRARTIEISQGNFKKDLRITSPPEIAELASSLNVMCEKLQEVDDIKSEFFSHMSHELRTPLTSIKVGTEMLLEGLSGELTTKQQHILSIVAKESDRLIELVNALLDLSKMEAGMMRYQFMPTDLSVLVKKSLDTLAPLIEAKNIAIDNRIGILQSINVDRERILQVLRNIIGNAIKFNYENGTIKLEAYQKGNAVEVAVHDTGPGLPKEDLERIFVKFQQVSPAQGGSVKGTGIGLATVKQVVLAHGGKVWATSQVGAGSTIHITLPLAG